MPPARFPHVPHLPAPRKRTRSLHIRPLGGVHFGLPPQDLPMGVAAAAQNLLPDVDGFMTPRSGLSMYSAYDFNGPVLGAAEVFDINGASAAFAPSSRSFSFLHLSNQAWSDLSYVPSNLTHFGDAPSGTSTDYFRTASIYDVNVENFIAVTSNNSNSAKFFVVADSAGTYSDFTFADSFASTIAAKDVVSVNDRLVFFNTLDAVGGRFPTRVLWSARGNPQSFLVDDGAGAEDLMDMKGEGQAAVRFRDFLLLFTEHEIWRATPTLDSYAFRFDRVVDSIGCRWPKTIATTPNGVIFLGRDHEVYVTDGTTVAPLGPIQGDGPSRIKRLLDDDLSHPDRAWATYNQTSHRYELYYSTINSPMGFPSRALFFSLDDRTWWPQTFSHGLSSGVDVTDPAVLITWDDVTDPFDDVLVDWDSFDVSQGNRRVNVFTADGETHRFRSDVTTDDGETILWKWRSGGFHGGDFKQLHLTEIWVDYEADASSSLSVFVGAARDASAFDEGVEVALSSPGSVSFIPTWKTGSAPNFEIRGNDGGRPRIASFSATLKDASRF